MKNVNNYAESFNPTLRKLVILIAITGAMLPLLLYWLVYGGVDSVMPVEAKSVLSSDDTHAILIDVRSAEQYAERHIDGAESWPWPDILTVTSVENIPERLKESPLLLVCNTGFRSVQATRHLTKLGLSNVQNVRGGIQEWIASAAGESPELFNRFRNTADEVFTFPFKDSPWYEQWAAFIGGIGFIKPTYTLLSLLIVIVLWKSTAPDLVALRWAMLSFFVGENFCAINYIVANDTSYLFEYLHGLGMTLCFGFATYSLLEGFDRRVLKLSDPNRKCAAINLCQECIKYTDVPCRLRQVFLVIIPACIIIAAMPLCVDFIRNSYNTVILRTFYNYSHRLVYQQYELLYCPFAAMILLTASLLVLINKKDNPLPAAKILFAAGFGPLGFSLLRMTLSRCYSTNMVWFNVWEESTELIFIVGAGVILWIFRHSLFPRRYEKPEVSVSAE